mgnify:FL=1
MYPSKDLRQETRLTQAQKINIFYLKKELMSLIVINTINWQPKENAPTRRLPPLVGGAHAHAHAITDTS